MPNTYRDDNFRIIGQARVSFHLSDLESVYVMTQNPVLCRQKEFVFSLGLFKQQLQIVPNWPLLGSVRRIPSGATASGYIFQSTFLSLSRL